jgi:hypothetical protein
MKASDWFGVGVRILGLWFLGHCVIYLASFLDLFLGITPLEDARVANSNAYLVYVVGYAFVGLVFVIGAGFLSRLFYGRSDKLSEKPPFDRNNEEGLFQSSTHS